MRGIPEAALWVADDLEREEEGKTTKGGVLRLISGGVKGATVEHVPKGR